MDRFGQPRGVSRSSSPSPISDKSAVFVHLMGNEDPINSEDDSDARNGKNPADGVRRVSSSSGAEDLAFVEFSRSRRRKSWWARLLMGLGLRRRRTFRSSSEGERAYSPASTKVKNISLLATAVRYSLRVMVLILAMFGIIYIYNYFIGLAPPLRDDASDYWSPAWSEPSEGLPSRYRYPTDATRDVLPIPCHSHNDYWRRIPLFEAVHYGCTGVEADVWLFDDDLYVGHDIASLTRDRTFRSLYIDPLVAMLDGMNPQTEFNNSTQNGVFDEDPSQSLVLLVDFKTDGRQLFPYVVKQITALREKNYLTYFNGTNVVPGPVVVVGTGNTPFDLIAAETAHRDIFFDAPLGQMFQQLSDIVPNDVTSTDAFNAKNSYYASVNFRSSIGRLWRGSLSGKQIDKIRGQIAGAHARGLKVRYWNTPAWPVGLRNRVWTLLVDEGADMLNVDDLRSAAKRDWRSREERENEL